MSLISHALSLQLHNLCLNMSAAGFFKIFLFFGYFIKAYLLTLYMISDFSDFALQILSNINRLFQRQDLSTVQLFTLTFKTETTVNYEPYFCSSSNLQGCIEGKIIIL